MDWPPSVSCSSFRDGCGDSAIRLSYGVIRGDAWCSGVSSGGGWEGYFVVVSMASSYEWGTSWCIMVNPLDFPPWFAALLAPSSLSHGLMKSASWTWQPQHQSGRLCRPPQIVWGVYRWPLFNNLLWKLSIDIAIYIGFVGDKSLHRGTTSRRLMPERYVVETNHPSIPTAIYYRLRSEPIDILYRQHMLYCYCIVECLYCPGCASTTSYDTYW